MRASIVGLGLTALVLGYAAPVSGQWLAVDARRIGMGGLAVGLSGGVVRFNPAYRAVRRHAARPGEPRLTVPIPLGLVSFFEEHPISHITHDPMFNPDSAAFNPVEAINTLLHPPFFLQVKTPPTPTNDWIFTIGRDHLVVDLGQSRELIPVDQFGFGGSSRPIDPGVDLKGVRLSVMTWFHTEVGFQLGDQLLAFLRDADSAQHNTAYTISADAFTEGGFAPTVSYSGRIAGDTAAGFYVGAALHYYVGAGYWRTSADSAGFMTGDTIFAGPTPVTPVMHAVSSYSRVGNSVGHGIGGDLGFEYASGPVEVGFGINDIGATITWPDTRLDTLRYDQAGDSVYSKPGLRHTSTTTRLPVTYIANLGYALGKTTLGVTVLNSGRGTTIQVGGEQRFGMLAARGGVVRDQRKRMQLAWGGGVRLGSFSLDAAFATYGTSLSNERGITMATSVAIY